MRQEFKEGDIVRHKRGGTYRIKAVPNAFSKLEYCNESFYEYEDCRTGTVWLRRKSQFEDGRFYHAEKEV